MIKSAAILKDGKIYTGYSHASILEENKIWYDSGEKEGFVTDEGLFVDRIIAAQIAFDCGQTKEKYNQLKSYHLS